MAKIRVVAYIEDIAKSTITIERSDGSCRTYPYGNGYNASRLSWAVGDYRVVEPRWYTVRISGIAQQYGSYKLFGSNAPRWYHWFRFWPDPNEALARVMASDRDLMLRKVTRGKAYDKGYRVQIVGIRSNAGGRVNMYANNFWAAGYLMRSIPYAPDKKEK